MKDHTNFDEEIWEMKESKYEKGFWLYAIGLGLIVGTIIITLIYTAGTVGK